MQHNEDLDREIRRHLSRHPVPGGRLKEELWKGVAAELDRDRAPILRRRRWAAGIAALFIGATGIGIYLSQISDTNKSLSVVNQTETIYTPSNPGESNSDVVKNQNIASAI